MNSGPWQGAAQLAAKDCIAWSLPGDHSGLIFIDAENKKKIMCLSQVACQAARNSGVTELTVMDHDVTQVVVDSWCSQL